MKKLICIISLMMVSIHFALAQTHDEVKELVKQTRVLVEQNATEAFKTINKGGFKTNPYAFVLDTNLIIVAHGANPELVGTNRTGFKDSNGKDYVKIMRTRALADGFGWVNYMHINPATGKDTKKLSYVELVTGSNGRNYIVGSGRYAK